MSSSSWLKSSSSKSLARNEYAVIALEAMFDTAHFLDYLNSLRDCDKSAHLRIGRSILPALVTFSPRRLARKTSQCTCGDRGVRLAQGLQDGYHLMENDLAVFAGVTTMF
jgi:hypothetical protein